MLDQHFRIAIHEDAAHWRKKIVNDLFASSFFARAGKTSDHSSPRGLFVEQRPKAFQVARAERLEKCPHDLLVTTAWFGHRTPPVVDRRMIFKSAVILAHTWV